MYVPPRSRDLSIERGGIRSQLFRFLMVVMAWGHVGVIDNGGIALEESYPYLMQDAWCLKTDRSSGVKVHNWI